MTPTSNRTHAGLLGALLLMSLLLTACSSGGPDADAGDSLQVAIEPSSIDVPLGGEGQVTVQLDDAFEGPVGLEIEGLPESLDAEFDPAAPSPGDSSTLTIRSNGAAEGTFPLAVVADDGGNTGSAEVVVSVEGIDVAGTIVDGLGKPVAALVSVAGRDAVPTGSDGRFSFDAVAVPYDLTVLDPAYAWAHQFVGLRTATPEAAPLPFLEGSERSNEATISGSFPSQVEPDQIAYACVESDDVAIAGCDWINDNFEAGTFEITASWDGAPDQDVTVRTVLYDLVADSEPDAWRPEGVLSTGTVEATLSDSDAIPVGEIAWNPAEASLLDMDVSLAAGLELEQVRAATHLPGGLASIPTPRFSDPPSTSLQLAAPHLEGASYTVYAVAESASGGAGRSIAWATDLDRHADVALELHAPPSPLAPSTGTTAGAGTTFTVAAPAGSANLFLFLPVDAGPRLFVSTTEAEATLPDLSSLDSSLALPSGATYAWAAYAASGVEEPDDLVDGAGVWEGYLGVENTIGGTGAGPEEDGFYLEGEGSHFQVP